MQTTTPYQVVPVSNNCLDLFQKREHAKPMAFLFIDRTNMNTLKYIKFVCFILKNGLPWLIFHN